MDAGLVAWGRAVKQRHNSRHPPLWFFTDAPRLPDPLPVIRRLPKFCAGVVFRHDDVAERAALGRKIAAICRARHLKLVVAGDARLAAVLHAGLHLRGGRRQGQQHLPDLVTSSAHNATELRRARRAGAALVFVSPVFATASHAGATPLGVLRWRALVPIAGRKNTAALGGISGRSVRGLGRDCAAAGAIEAFF